MPCPVVHNEASPVKKTFKTIIPAPLECVWGAIGNWDKDVSWVPGAQVCPQSSSLASLDSPAFRQASIQRLSQQPEGCDLLLSLAVECHVCFRPFPRMTHLDMVCIHFSVVNMRGKSASLLR